MIEASLVGDRPSDAGVSVAQESARDAGDMFGVTGAPRAHCLV